MTTKIRQTDVKTFLLAKRLAFATGMSEADVMNNLGALKNMVLELAAEEIEARANSVVYGELFEDDAGYEPLDIFISNGWKFSNKTNREER